MQFDIRNVDPPGWSIEFTVGVLVLLGSLVGLFCLAVRLARLRIGLRDVAAWLCGAAFGAAFGLVQDNQIILLGLICIGACMGAGVWIAAKRDSELRVIGFRLLEAASLGFVVALWSNRP
jgi:lipoprotein signal peptidase